MSHPGVLFVCSNSTHVRMFAPVIRRLAAHGLTGELLSLDEYYGQGVVDESVRQNVAATSLPRAGDPLVTPFYRRSALAMWRDALSAGAESARLLDSHDRAAVVVGNDFGLIERACLRQAARRRIRTVLVQDGRLGATTRPRPATLGASIRSLVRRTLSAVLAAVGLRHLASAEYGSGGTDVVCASGPAGRRILEQRVRRGTPVMVTGQPRYDAIIRVQAQSDSTERGILFFTTPFLDVLRDREAQFAQERALRWAVSAADTLGARVIVKPHPREASASYAGIGAEVAEPTTAPEDLLRVAWVVIAGPSTMAEEAGLAARPVVCIGPTVIGQRYAAFIPPDPPYQRFESLEELRDLLMTFADEDGRHRSIELQRAHVADHLLLVDDAASRVAAVVASQ